MSTADSEAEAVLTDRSPNSCYASHIVTARALIKETSLQTRIIIYFVIRLLFIKTSNILAYNLIKSNKNKNNMGFWGSCDGFT